MHSTLENARSSLVDGRLSRRDFILRATALGVSIPSALALADSALAAAPRRGGHLIAGLSTGATSDSLDPTTYTDWGRYTVGTTICNYLVELDDQKNPVPELATSWEAQNDAKKWVFELRKGITFSNGKPFTAADVVYSLNRHRGDSTASPAKPLLEGVTDIRADGDHTVVIELIDGDADMPQIMATYQLAIVPDGHEDWRTLIGTGGYIVESFEPGVRFLAKRNPNYWKPDRAWLDSYESLSILDPGARASAIRSGSAQLIDRADTKIVNRFEGDDRFIVIENKGTAYDSSAMDSRVAPFNNNDVRLALKYAVDRNEMLQKIHKGYGTVANDHPVPPNDPYFNSELQQRPYDPEKAKFHLKKAGLESLDVNLSASDLAFNGAVDAAVLFGSQAKAAGINITPIREPSDGYWSNVWMVKPFSMVTWSVRVTPALQFSIAYACGAPWADSYLCHDRFEMLLRESKRTTDFAKRKEIFGEMQAIQSDEGANHVFMFESAINIFSSKVGGAKADAAAPNMGMRAAERLWMKE